MAADLFKKGIGTYNQTTKEADMPYYYVNKNQQANGDHEVHKKGCSWLPLPSNRIYLGDFLSCGQRSKRPKNTTFR